MLVKWMLVKLWWQWWKNRGLQMLEVMFMMQAPCCLMLIFQELLGSDDLEAPCEWHGWRNTKTTDATARPSNSEACASAVALSNARVKHVKRRWQSRFIAFTNASSCVLMDSFKRTSKWKINGTCLCCHPNLRFSGRFYPNIQESIMGMLTFHTY